MSLANGIYTLRASPAFGVVGGMFATGHNEVDAAVTTAPQDPPFSDHQHWKIAVVNAEENIYAIMMETSGAVFGGFFSTMNPSGVPDGPIVTSEKMQEWYIVPVDTGLPGTYAIRPVTYAVDMDWYVGTEGNKVVIKAYMVQGPDEPKPYWQI